MNIGFERIDPAPPYPPGTDAPSLSGRQWSDDVKVVNTFKEGVKKSLREAQLGRCAFCRRVLFDDYATHIEHFIEKAQHPEYTFAIANLSVCCGTCNGQKNATNLRFLAAMKNRAKRPRARALNLHCRTLTTPIAVGAPLPANPNDYRWVHPHVDAYSQHIKIEKGWVFVGNSRKGIRTIRGVSLNSLYRIEQRALFERLTARGGRLSMLVGAIAALNEHRAHEVASAVVAVLKRRR